MVSHSHAAVAFNHVSEHNADAHVRHRRPCGSPLEPHGSSPNAPRPYPLDGKLHLTLPDGLLPVQPPLRELTTTPLSQLDKPRQLQAGRKSDLPQQRPVVGNRHSLRR